MPDPRLADAIRRLRDALAELRADWSRMPFFVRPMARAGFERRTGRSLERWEDTLADLAQSLDAEHPVIDRAELGDALGRLAEHFRTAPERAARFMRVDLDLVRERSRAREDAARALADALTAGRPPSK